MSNLGVTPPISMLNSSPEEEAITQELKKYLLSMNVIESPQELERRERVLKELTNLVKKFVFEVSISKKIPTVVAKEAGGKIFTFGSYRLGVHGVGADIDTLCVVPKFVNREDFFTKFHEMLLNNPALANVTAVADSYVPVMKMEFDTIPIDLVFARLEVSSVPDHLEIADDSLLKNLDERCVRSLNGSRVTDEILRLVPNQENFKTTLRSVKLWAKKRAIYSNIMGFLGGVAWAMMVARVCQLYPNATAAVLLSKFFRIMAQWKWPQPVLLKPIDDGPLQVRVWNPKTYPMDRAHRMPIITPAYPSMCATHNVTASTLKIIINELTRGAEITEKILKHEANWDQLFAKHDFFHKYKYYLQVIASSDSMDNQRIWSALVESKLRHLVLKLEVIEDLESAHPFIKGYDKTVVCYSEQQAIDAGRGIFSQPNTPEDTTLSKDSRTVCTTTFYVGLQITSSSSNGDGKTRKLDLGWPTLDFTQMCKQWDQFNEKNKNFIDLCSMLPNDVFDEGEVRKLKRVKPSSKNISSNELPPEAPLKKTAVESHPPLKKRRSISIDGSNEHQTNTSVTSPLIQSVSASDLVE